jgi:hypothetical protein
MSVMHAPGRGARVNGGPAGSISGRGIGGRVLVLNATFEPIHVCSVRRATVLLLKAKAEILEAGELMVRSERLQLDRPVVIRLVAYVRVPRDVHRRKGNRLPREIQMHPKKTPRPPGPNIFIRVAAPKPPPSWEQYLSPLPQAA